MAFDLQSVVEAAARAALDDSGSGQNTQNATRRRGLSAPRAFLVGAGVLVAGPLLVSSLGWELVETVHDRLADYREEHLDGAADEEPEDPEDEYEEEDEDEPEEEDEEEYEAEEEDEPEDEDERPRAGSGARSRRGR
jgi:hypothetical protein